MKILVAVKSSAKAWMQGCHEPIRETWGSKIKACTKYDHTHLKFFFGNGSSWLLAPHHDEVHIDAPDEYKDLSKKVNKILEYSISEGYDFTYLCDTDTFCRVDRLHELLWHSCTQSDYLGWIIPWEPKFAFGGCGFVVSRRAAQIVVNEPVQDPMDDISIGKILYGRNGITVIDGVRGFNLGVGWHFTKNVYAVKRYDPKFPWMRLMAEKHLGMTFNDEPEIPIIGEPPAKDWRKWDVTIGGAKRTVTLGLTGEDLIDDYEGLMLQSIR
jgi:hypothetical protein